jgi:hypothetical protein
MKYIVRVSALCLVFASGMLAQPTPNVNRAAVSADKVSHAWGPVPQCDPNDPACVEPSFGFSFEQK